MTQDDTLVKHPQGSLLADFWTLVEMADEVGVSTRTLGRWHNMRIGPPRTLLGNRVLYHKQAARAWVLAQAEHVAIRGAA